ncbi:MAG: sigma-70 family RNA polymerase sigma factor [Candidatus Nitrospinota bacterium M3_3B_026]
MGADKNSRAEENPLRAYLKDISGIHPLSRSEEKELGRKHDEASLRELVERNLKYVVMVANQYKGMGLSLEDLINEGNLGMMEAARRFDPERGVKFITYAVWWIRQAILRALADQARVVRLPMKQAGLMSKMAKSVDALTHKLGREPALSEVAESLGVKVKALERVMRVYKGYMSLDSPLSRDNDSTHFVDMLETDPEHSIEDDYIRLCLHHDMASLLKTLPQREEAVLRFRYGFDEPPMTLEEIGRRMGLTRERIRQIEKQAKEKLRSRLGVKVLEDYIK